ncbi:MAG TPA: acyl-CoA thioesterase domain-containing protein [Acidimicrobiales bacterium]
MDFATMMALEQHGIDTWVGAGPKYPWGGLYGGQIVAQALRAAAETVDPQFRVHSLHAYFIRRGDHDEPIRFEVDRIRNGRSFLTRSVVARQSIGAIFNLSASFQKEEDAVEVQTATLPDLPPPESLRSDSWSPIFDRRFAPPPGPGQVAAWLRVEEPVGDDPTLQACAFAYLSDDLPTDAVATVHPARIDGDQFHQRFFSASLDHAIWFHRPFRTDEWHVQTFTCHGLMGSRGLSIGYVFTADGTHVATISQEVLFRELRPGRG